MPGWRPPHARLRPQQSSTHGWHPAIELTLIADAVEDGAMADAAVVPAATEVPARHARTGQGFYVGFGVFVVLLSFAGFAPSLIDHSRRYAPPMTLHLLHGATALAWLLLYVTQALLVARGRVDLHRRLGWAAPVMAALLVLFAYYTISEGAFRASDLSGDIYRILIEPGTPPLSDAENVAGFWGSFGELVTFSLLVTAGLVFRHRAALHKRLMVFALMPLGPESLLHLTGTLVGRVPLSRATLLVGMLVIDVAVLFIPAVHEKLTRGRVHRASICIPLLIIVWTSRPSLVASSRHVAKDLSGRTPLMGRAGSPPSRRPRPRPPPRFALRRHLAVVAPEFARGGGGWLGIRDDFHNWLIRAA